MLHACCARRRGRVRGSSSSQGVANVAPPCVPGANLLCLNLINSITGSLEGQCARRQCARTRPRPQQACHLEKVLQTALLHCLLSGC